MGLKQKEKNTANCKMNIQTGMYSNTPLGSETWSEYKNFR